MHRAHHGDYNNMYKMALGLTMARRQARDHFRDEVVKGRLADVRRQERSYFVLHTKATQWPGHERTAEIVELAIVRADPSPEEAMG